MACKGGRLISRKGGDASERIRSTIRNVPVWNLDRRVNNISYYDAYICKQKEIDRPVQR